MPGQEYHPSITTDTGRRVVDILFEQYGGGSVTDHAALKSRDIRADMRLYPEGEADNLGFDSLDIIETVMEAEECFGISVPDGDIDGLQTVDGFINYVRGCLNKNISMERGV